ncbi:hypothetical protein EDC61_109128 [Sulfuritortus calidifontis]|jgi:hypothetical protein|uniref:Uncharacterized protein n=1 Tax=Sulfuritortus calidifontis TaxID=1914471 RepID=A0A4R3JUX8_9PROT|nr:hypothetical protein [Sulfuritortus calidifontis]TCS71582.1 hypothetical protein EDC61_109128 [Sulfuritortus calidifontis]
MRAVGEKQADLPSEPGRRHVHELLNGLDRLRPELGTLADELICLLQGGSPADAEVEQELPEA